MKFPKNLCNSEFIFIITARFCVSTAVTFVDHGISKRPERGFIRKVDVNGRHAGRRGSGCTKFTRFLAKMIKIETIGGSDMIGFVIVLSTDEYIDIIKLQCVTHDFPTPERQLLNSESNMFARIRRTDVAPAVILPMAVSMTLEAFLEFLELDSGRYAG